MKAIILARVSTEEQKEAGNSLPAQVERLLNYCERKNFKVIKRFSFDESAYKNKRSEFDKIIEEVRRISKKEKIIVCLDKVDRLSRNIFDKRVSALYGMALQDRIEIHFASEGQIVNSQMSATGNFHFGMNLTLAKYYSDAISDNVKRAYEQKLRNGEWIGQAYIGYQNVTLENEKKHIAPDKDRSHFIQRIFSLYATRDYSIKDLSKKMYAEGLRSRKGVKVSTSQIHNILRNPFYHGTMIVKGVPYPHKYEPLISKPLFDRVQDVINGYNRQNFKRTNKPYIFRGLIKCSECGCSITPELQKGHIYYHCTNYHGNCPNKATWLREEDLIGQIEETFQSLRLKPNALEKLKDKLRDSHKNEQDFYQQNITAIKRKLGQIDTRLNIIYDDRLDGRISTEEYDKRVEKYKKEQQDLLQQYEEHSQGDKNFYMTASKVLDLSQRAWELFQNSEPKEKTQLVGFLLQNLSLQGRNLVFEVKTPFNGIVEYAKTKEWLRGQDSNL